MTLRTITHTAFPADRSNPRAYHGGDLKGILDYLDYLQELGITAVWLSSVVASDPHSRDYHGYGGTDLYRIDPRLGILADYQHLTAELHKRGMKLFFDDVPNDVGPAHAWTTTHPCLTGSTARSPITSKPRTTSVRSPIRI